MTPLAIRHATLTTALGAGLDANWSALAEGRTGLAPRRFEDADLPGWIGLVEGLEAVELPTAQADHDCRNNRLAWFALQQDGFSDAVREACTRWGAARVAVVLGTSTSGILHTEMAYRHRQSDGALPPDFHYAHTHNTGSLAAFVGEALGIDGPGHVVSTACSSSAKVFATASRLIDAGLVDAAVVGGVDSLCLTTLYGFNSLELFSSDICRPWDAQRDGLSLGEGAAFALLERPRDDAPEPLGWLLGTGETSDGHHMSTPHPQGAGAVAAMRQALAAAGLQPHDIGYINLHGTATPNNDSSEDRAVTAVFGTDVPCSSTKGATGHTLGAAGGVEAVISLLALRHGVIPGGRNRREPAGDLNVRYIDASEPAPLRAVLSNSFGFGGSNASLVLGAAQTVGAPR